MAAAHIASAVYPIIQEIPFGKIIPALAAGALYLNGRFYLGQDLTLSKNYFLSMLTFRLREARDRLNSFYRLEEWALSPHDANRKFIIYNGRSWSFKQSYDNTLKYAAWLHHQKGVKKADVVAIDSMNSDTFIWLWLAIWSLGAKPAFINYNLTQTPLIHSIQVSGAKLIVVEEEVYTATFSESVQQALADMDVSIIDEAVKSKIESQGDTYRAPNLDRAGQKFPDLAMLIYTSGTTGLPKPAVVSWSKAAAATGFVAAWMGLKYSDVFYTCMPLYHSSASLLAFGSCLASGATLSLGKKFHRTEYWNEVRSSKATVIHYVGETCRYLLSSPPSPLDTQHNVRLAMGNGLRPDIWEKFKDRFGIPSIAEFYGATEGPSATWNLSNNSFSSGAVGRIGLIGKIVFGPTSAIVEFDTDTNTIKRDIKTGYATRVDVNQRGELISRLDKSNIQERFQGYYKNDGATSKKVLFDVFEQGDAWFSTGDLMRKSPDGLFYFCDRLGDTFRWKSENVSTAEVSDVLGKYDGLEEVNVYGVEVPNHDGRAGCATVIIRPGREVEPVLEELAGYVRENLPKYAIPLFLRVTSNMQSQTTGTNKQQKTTFRLDGIDPQKVHDSNPNDQLFWLPPGARSYKKFGDVQWRRLEAHGVKL